MLSFLPPRWRRYLRWTIMLIVMLLFAAHPEVRLMVPVLDAIGFDALLMLFGAQMISTYADVLVPILRGLRYAVLAPSLQWLDASTRRLPLICNVRAWCSEGLRRRTLGRQLWLRCHVAWWSLVRRGAPKDRALGWTPMTEPSRVRYLPAPQLAATVAATFAIVLVLP